jgi:uroporphyrin-III C-methyltransferase/precorrin-2 dehydrogenase/sirohydrochlorin ferrochelatase
LTHRGIASGFLVVSGHRPAAYASVLNGLPPNSVTVVVLMGLANRHRLGQMLVRFGWRPSTPVAIVTSASQITQRTWHGTLEDLGTAAPAPPHGAPGIIVIGEVVAVGNAVAAAMSGGAWKVSVPERGQRGDRRSHVSNGRSEDLRTDAALVRR